MKKIILFGSLLACFLMLMVPVGSAINGNAVVSRNIYFQIDGPDFDAEELKETILQRIEELKGQDISLNNVWFNWTDPDGPFEGGLDDLTDFIDLISGVFLAGYLLLLIKKGYLRNSQSLLEFVEWIIVYAQYSILTLVSFGEAFDIIEWPPADGR
jgi:hypothetical protein